MQTIETVYFLQAAASTCAANWHIVILIIIMLLAGAFGGYLNYLNSFDIDTAGVTTPPTDDDKNRAKLKYTLLGIGAAFLVPAFLKMINSGLIDSDSCKLVNCINYLIFTGFCLIVAMFSRRFITSIADKVLEAAKKAEIVAKESKQAAAEADKKATEGKQVAEEAGKKAEEAKKDATTAQQDAKSAHTEALTANETAKDVKQNIDLTTQVNKAPVAEFAPAANNNPEELLSIVQSYKEKTKVDSYSERVKIKGDLRRSMGNIIVKQNLNKTHLFDLNQSEAMLLGIAYSMQLRPEAGDVELLNQIAKLAKEKYTRYTILNSYDTLLNNLTITNDQVKAIYDAISKFDVDADAGLINKLNDTKRKLQVNFPGVQP